MKWKLVNRKVSKEEFEGLEKVKVLSGDEKRILEARVVKRMRKYGIYAYAPNVFCIKKPLIAERGRI